MRRLLFALALLAVCGQGAAQYYSTLDSSTGIRMFSKVVPRREIVLPKIDGYTLYKADFHIHTIYSDGDVTPRERVREAWYDGLDIIAITDHLEIRTYEKFMLKALAPYSKDGEPFVYQHAGIANKEDKDAPVLSNLNASYDEAVYYAQREGLPIMVVRGTEIWRRPELVGEYNALFLTDINAICHQDLIESFRRVKAQGGVIQHNHPGWSRQSMEMGNEEQIRAYDEGWVDGVEVINSSTLYPTIARRCAERGLFMTANTDAHHPTAQVWGADKEFFRTMTFVMAKQCTEESIKEALLKQRTICYSGNNLVAEESLLCKFLNAAVECKVVAKDKKNAQRTYCLTNTCSIPFLLRKGGSVYILKPFTSQTFTLGKDEQSDKYLLPRFTVDNMWHIDEQHPVIEIAVDKR